ncbi:MAG: outer membrane protein assembly factor BamD [bacterium]|nr:outer membrane protein assembly factor BamD [bacterium]
MKKTIFLIMIAAALFSCAKKTVLSDSLVGEEDLFNSAYKQYEAKKWGKAIDLFQKYIFSYPANKRTESAQFYLADAFFSARSYTEAIVELEYFLDNYKNYNMKKDASYKLAYCYYKLSPSYQFDQTLSKNAINVMRGFIRDYPESEHRQEIDSLSRILISRLEEKKMHTGNFYMKKRDYISAEIYYLSVDMNNIEEKHKDNVRLSLAGAQLNLKKYDEAKTNLQKITAESRHYKKAQNLLLKISKLAG